MKNRDTKRQVGNRVLKTMSALSLVAIVGFGATSCKKQEETYKLTALDYHVIIAEYYDMNGEANYLLLKRDGREIIDFKTGESYGKYYDNDDFMSIIGNDVEVFDIQKEIVTLFGVKEEYSEKEIVSLYESIVSRENTENQINNEEVGYSRVLEK